MSEHQANLALVERADNKQWKVGKHFNTLPPTRKKSSLFQRIIKFFKG